MLIDTSYFEGDLSIGQITSDAVIADVNLFMSKHEEDLLTILFGYPLYKLFAAAIGTETPDQRFKDLRDGKEYQWNGNTVKWRGLKFTSGTFKRSLIANFVYFMYMKDNATWTTGAGVKKSTSPISVNVSPRIKMVRAWNEMVEMNIELMQFLQQNQSVYPEWIQSNYEYNVYNGLSNSRIFYLKKINSFGI